MPPINSDLLEDSDDHLADPPTNGNELYERWRAGLIRRHICANGRLNENTFLQEQRTLYNTDDAARPRIDYNHRRANEIWVGPPGAGNDNLVNPKEKVWWPAGTPIRNKSGGRFEWIETGEHWWGGGDNPLLSGGLALAMFSIEAMQEVSQHSFDYARMLFRYILKQEAAPGYFARYGTKLKHASTDELCGLCVGLYFYHKACSHRNDRDERVMVENLVRRMAENLNSHGYWILPPSWAFATFPPGAIPPRPLYTGPISTPELGHQRGYIFAFVFKLFFKKIAGVETNSSWDEGEFLFYFGYPYYDPRRYTSWPPPMYDDIGTLLEATSIASLCIIDQKMFFASLLLALSSASSIEDAIKSLPIEPFLRKPSDIKPFNYHMIGLMSILLIELIDENVENNLQELYGFVSTAFRGILGLESHKDNSFYGLISLRARGLASAAGVGSLNEGIDFDAMKILDDPKRWQHDLPIGQIKVLNDLFQDDPKNVLSNKLRIWIESKYGSNWSESGQTWIETFRGWKLPFDYNPKNKWGEARTWEHEYKNHVYTKNWYRGRADKTEGPGIKSILAKLFDHNGLDIKIEGCGLGMLFPRILASYWGLLSKPNLTRDIRWRTLPPDVHFLVEHSLYKLKHKHEGYPNWMKKEFEVRYNTLSNRNRGITKVLQDQKHFPFPRVQRMRHNRSMDDVWVLFSHTGTIIGGNGRFRGRRVFHYDDEPYYFVKTSDSAWEFYLQFSTSTEAFEKSLPIPDWMPSSQDHYYDIPKFPVLELSKGTSLWTDQRLKIGGLESSSFLFYRIKAHPKYITAFLPARQSVGNENIKLNGMVRRHWRYLYEIPEDLHTRPYVLNRHTGVIHNLTTEKREHFQGMIHSRNMLLLPIKDTVDLTVMTKEELNSAIGKIVTYGNPNAPGNPQEFFLLRKNMYSLPFKYRNHGPINTFWLFIDSRLLI